VVQVQVRGKVGTQMQTRFSSSVVEGGGGVGSGEGGLAERDKSDATEGKVAESRMAAIPSFAARRRGGASDRPHVAAGPIIGPV
jgi:hypothetical protein